jgi:hypothetical protein
MSGCAERLRCSWGIQGVSPAAALGSASSSCAASGAVGVLFVQSPERLERQTRVLGYPWPALSRLPGGSLPLQPRRADTAGLPAYAIGRAAVEALFGSLDAFREWLRAQDTAPTPALLPEVRVDLSVALVERERVRVPNVVGWIPGQRAREEYILLGAHYDHVGTYSSPGEQDSIYNGADDNASGTAWDAAHCSGACAGAGQAAALHPFCRLQWGGEGLARFAGVRGSTSAAPFPAAAPC